MRSKLKILLADLQTGFFSRHSHKKINNKAKALIQTKARQKKEK